MTWNEYRNELQDSIFNFMDLAEPIEITYLNLSDKVEIEELDEQFSVQMRLTNEVFI